MTLLALDASALIYLVEGTGAVRDRLSRRIADVLGAPTGRIVASRLARLECRVKPLRDADTAILEEYDAIFAAEELFLVDVSAAVLERATELRARHGFKTPDAIHLATALEAGATTFLTGDTSLAKCAGLTVEIVSP